jgi:DNA helicase MCM9
VCKLNTRCSILAACNVKGELEDGKTISSTLALASPLLSRFDLIFLLLDRGKRDAQWDSALCDQLLGIQQEGVDKSNDKNDNTEDNIKGNAVDNIEGNDIEGNTVDKSNDKSDNTMGKSGVIPTSTTTTTRSTTWDFDKLKLYVNFVRTELNPPLNQVSELVLSKYYQFQRSNDSNHSVRTTVRLLESLVRLAQAHAKLMFHEQVQLRDAVNAIILMEASLTSSTSNDAGLNDLNAECPEDFESTYADFESGLLRKLEINLANIISESEDDELDHLLNEVEMTDEFDE